MERKEGGQEKEVKILKCVKCGKEYIFDSSSQNCPECGGALRKSTAVIRSRRPLFRLTPRQPRDGIAVGEESPIRFRQI